MKIATIATIALLATTTLSFASGDADKGAKVFKKKCKSCHMIGENAKAKVGPPLNNVLGATAGTNEGFPKYSKNMKKAGEEGLVWTEETLGEFLNKPKAMIKKTKMSFKGFSPKKKKKQEDKLNVIAYLATFSPDYKPAE